MADSKKTFQFSATAPPSQKKNWRRKQKLKTKNKNGRQRFPKPLLAASRVQQNNSKRVKPSLSLAPPSCHSCVLKYCLLLYRYYIYVYTSILFIYCNPFFISETLQQKESKTRLRFRDDNSENKSTGWFFFGFGFDFLQYWMLSID